jgi:hypothetical protein
MAPMAQHDSHEAAARPLRRARAAAWAVFLGMAGTSMAFQTYHSLHYGQMPWGLAYLYGIVPLAISVGVLAFAAHWSSNWARAGAYAVAAGAMFLAASATGKVSQNAAPSHASLLFGLLMDGAALLAIHFIFNGPTAAQAVAEVARREAELTASVSAAQDALSRAVAGHREAFAEAEAGHAAEAARLRADLAAAAESAETQQAEAMRVHRMTVQVLEDRVEAARQEAETLAAKNEALTRKLDRATGSGKGGNGTRKQAGTAAGTSAPAKAETAPVSQDDLPGNWDALDTEARVLFLVNEKGYSGSKAGLAAGVTDARGRQIARMARGLSTTAPQDVVGEAKEG